MKWLITIDNGEKLDWLYLVDNEWQAYVDENLTEKMVLFSDYDTIDKASWWNDAKEISDLFIECYGRWDRFKHHLVLINKYSQDTINELVRFGVEDVTETVREEYLGILKIIKPELEFEQTTIRGDVQGEWADVIYIKDSLDIGLLESYYFGKLREIFVENDYESFADVITDDEYFEYDKKGLKKSLIERFEIPEDDEIVLKIFTGYNYIANYETL